MGKYRIVSVSNDHTDPHGIHFQIQKKGWFRWKQIGRFESKTDAQKTLDLINRRGQNYHNDIDYSGEDH